MTDMSFGSVSPVSGQDYFANGTLSVTCTAANSYRIALNGGAGNYSDQVTALIYF